MKRLTTLVAVVLMLLTAGTMKAQHYGIVFGELEVDESNASDIFGDGLASYDAAQNKLILCDGFDYHLSHGLVTINTGRAFHVVLKGKALMVASVDCGDPMVMETEDEGLLQITSNISGSALKCESLTLMSGVTLDLLSRNSQKDMYALDCMELTANKAVLYAEVTTAELAVHINKMTLNDCWMQKPRGGSVNDAYGGICYADGLPAKQVRIIVEGYGLEEIVEPSPWTMKTFENGRIVIIQDGKKYDVTGRKL